MKKILLSLFIFLFVIPQFLFGQGGWVIFFQGQGAETGGKVVKTSDGNYAFPIATSQGLNNDSTSGNYIIKLDIDGNIFWTKKISAPVFTPNIIPTNDNGFLITPSADNLSGIPNSPTFFIKLDENGNTEWTKDFILGNDSTSHTKVIDMIPTSDGGYIFLGKHFYSSASSAGYHYISKVDENLEESWVIEKHNYTSVFSLTQFPNGDFSAGGVLSDIMGSQYFFAAKYDENGNEIFEYSIPANPSPYGKVHSVSDGGIMLFAQAGTGINTQYRIDSIGNLLWEKQWNINSNFFFPIHSNDFTYTSSTTNSLIGISIEITKADLNGDIVWQKQHKINSGNYLEFSPHIIETADQGILGIGIHSTSEFETFAFKTDSLGQIFPNTIFGKVTRDEQSNCQLDSNEMEISNWIISAENPERIFYTISDSLGNYSLPVDSNSYVLSIHPPNNLWIPCENDIDILFTNQDSIEQNFSTETIFDCPYLNLSSTFPSARPCFTNRYFISYCNQGTTTANNAYMEIKVDSNLTYENASINLTTQNNNTFTFNLGDISIGECGDFYIDFLLDCDVMIGESICIESHIYPDSICSPDPNWNGAFVEVDAYCQDSIIKFYLENVGLMDMPTSKEYIVVEDAILLISDDYQLLAGEIDSISFPTNGATFFMAAEQVENAPGDPFPTAWIEGCTTNGSTNFSLGFVNQFPLGDDTPFVDIDCTIASSSYDPNDKQGFPLGYDNEHFIRPNTDLEYQIRFQNTGNDTAFTVVIRDTIAPELDIPSIQVGAASHDYTWRIYGENILEFTFNVIMLPDSNVNEPASHGFVEFKISQKENLPLGTVIKNKAAIYFDYNDPIITNETFHTLRENFITVSTQRPIGEDYSLLVRPNPLQEFAIFEMKKEIKNGLFELYDATGRLAYQQKFNGSQFELKRNNLNAGIYFYKISENGNAINSGKIIVL